MEWCLSREPAIIISLDNVQEDIPRSAPWLDWDWMGHRFELVWKACSALRDILTKEGASNRSQQVWSDGEGLERASGEVSLVTCRFRLEPLE